MAALAGLQGGPHPGAAGPDDDRVELVDFDRSSHHARLADVGVEGEDHQRTEHEDQAGRGVEQHLQPEARAVPLGVVVDHRAQPVGAVQLGEPELQQVPGLPERRGPAAGDEAEVEPLHPAVHHIHDQQVAQNQDHEQDAGQPHEDPALRLAVDRVAACAAPVPRSALPHQLRALQLDLHAAVRRTAGGPGSRPPADHECAGRRGATAQLRLRRRPLVLSVLADLGPVAALARRAARHKRAAHSDQRLRRARRHALPAEDAALHLGRPGPRARYAGDLHLRPQHRLGGMVATPIEIHKFDTVVVGAGGAGMRAALEAGQRSHTAVLTKLYPTRSHTGAAQGGMCAALANVEEDNWEWHTFDTIKGGDYLVDQDAAEVMCKEAIDAVLDLEKMGLPFSRTPQGRIDQRRFGGHTRDHGKAAVRRSCYAADRTGHMILQTLYQQCTKHEIEFFNEFYVLDLVLAEGAVAGVVAYELATGTLHVFQAKAVVFATGGFGKMYKVSSNAHTLTGDGPGIIWRKGLPLEDMEFFQFHPTGIWKMGILLSEAARG